MAKSDEEKAANARVMRMAGILGAVGMVVLAVLTYAVLNGKLDLSGGVTPQEVGAFEDRLRYVIRYQTPPAAILAGTCLYVVSGRVKAGALNPLHGPEQKLTAQHKIMSNTLEQTTLLVLNQLILATHLDPETLLKVVPLITVTYSLGRVAFILGYPEKRSLGNALGMTPILAATAYNSLQFVKFIKLI